MNDSFPPQIDGVGNAVVNYGRYIEQNHGSAIVAVPSHPQADDGKFPFPVLRYPSFDASRFVGYRAGYPFSPEVAGELVRRKTELLHAHCPIVSTFLARSLRGVIDAPLVLTYHTKFDVDIAEAIRSKRLQARAIRALVENVNACDEVWVVSRGAGENLRALGYEGEYIVMNNGVDFPRGRVGEAAIQAVTAGYDLPQTVPIFLFVGRMRWYKGLRLIIDALARLKEVGADFRMVFIGSGADEEEVRTYCAAQGLCNRCFFPGAITEREILRAWYCRADALLFPSTFDTNGLVVREAAACSLPAVLVRGSCAAEGTRDGEDAFLIEETAQSLSALLAKLCSDRPRMRAVGERASRTLYLSWEDAVERAAERYEIVIDAYRSGKTPHHGGGVEHLLRSQGELMEAVARMERRKAVRRGGICGENRGRTSHAAGSLRYRVIR
ncbi:MAG: glycosyltransferase [Oscillospiraceae bacterium]|nr:glycosyltransferase [Oscillospiraceae bacterium]